MRSVAMVVGLSIVLFSASGWSETKFFKIPTPPPETGKDQVTAPPKPAQTDAEKETAGTGAKTQKPGRPFITSVQIGSYPTLDQARKEVSRLQALGIDTFIRPQKIRGKGTQYRVFAGTFDSKSQAQEYQQELKRKGIIHKSWIKRLRATPDQAAPSDKKQGQKPPSVRQPAKSAPKPAAKKAPARKKTKRPKKLKKPPVSAKARPHTLPRPPAVPKKTKPRTKPPKKPVKKTAAKAKAKKPGRFSLGPRAGLLYALGASDFRITRVSGSNLERWEFEDLKPLLGICIGWRFNDRWHLEGLLERVVMANIKLEHLTLGPKMHITKSGTVRPYARAALIYGSLEWDEAPGDFDSSVGLETGFGVDFMGTDFSFGLEAAYRYMAFDYNPPSGTGVTATDSQIDFSGFTVTGCARAHF
jgi:hypothetical protein